MMILSFSSLLVTATGIIMVMTRSTTASQAGFILSFALTASAGLLSLLELLTGLDQSMVAIERLNESEWGSLGRSFQMLILRALSVCDLPTEHEAEVCVAPPARWPANGSISVRDLCVRYDKDLPDVLTDLNLDIKVNLLDELPLRSLILLLGRSTCRNMRSHGVWKEHLRDGLVQGH